MAITNKDIEISNLSYTRKDFGQIYPELVEEATKLTNKWSPESTNESDPGLVLLKEMAFIGDKTNYNIDKNILERFVPSVTQDSSMRKIMDLQGYSMGYYESCMPTTYFTYIGGQESIDNLLQNNGSVKFKAFETTFSNEDNTLMFTLLNDFQLEKSNINSAIELTVIQGKVETLSAENSSVAITYDNTLIQLYNLDDENRIFLPEVQIAENGIFISTESSTLNQLVDDWQQAENNNLNTYPVGSKVFKFGFDSEKNRPFIQFPDDIADLIENGLQIKYTITDGVDGNISKNAITKMTSSTEISGSDTEISWTDDAETNTTYVISNLSSSTGKNPQTIDEAYIDYKKTIGTFNTLVTTRDYANYSYFLEDNLNNNLVSNIQVTDRRNDINYSTTVDSFGDYDRQYITVVDTKNGEPELTAFDLCLYPLRPINTDFNYTTYNASFTPLRDTISLEQRLEESKSISHDYKEFKDTDIYLIKNLAKLDATIATTYKVNSREEADILANVGNALITNFNSRNVDYGEEIPYEIILNTIVNADSRIKSVNLAEPELNTVITTYDNQTYNFIDGTNTVINGDDWDREENLTPFEYITAKNVLAGRVELYDYYDYFNYEFGTAQYGSISPVVNNIRYVTPEFNATISSGGHYPLNQNEIIQIIQPNLITKKSFGAGVWINIDDTDSGSNPKTYFKNVPYLVNTLIIKKTGRTGSNVSGFEKYKNVVITFSDDVTIDYSKVAKYGSKYDAINNGLGTFETREESNLIPYPSLSTSITFDIKDINKKEFTALNTRCFWIRNNDDNTLFDGNKDVFLTDPSVILEDGEYFIVPNDTNTALVIYGSGTQISYKGTINNPTASTNSSILDADSIYEMSLQEFENAFDWQYLVKSDTRLIVTNLTITTLVENNTLNNNTSSPVSLTSKWKEVTIGTGEDLTCKFENGEDIVISRFPISGYNTQARSLLIINSSKDNPQQLLSGQKITLTTGKYLYSTDTTGSWSPDSPDIEINGSDSDNVFIQLGDDIYEIGKQIDLTKYNYSSGRPLKTVNTEETGLNNAYIYKSIDITRPSSLSADQVVYRKGTNYSTLSLKGPISSGESITLPLTSGFSGSQSYAFMMYTNSDKLSYKIGNSTKQLNGLVNVDMGNSDSLQIIISNNIESGETVDVKFGKIQLLTGSLNKSFAGKISNPPTAFNSYIDKFTQFNKTDVLEKDKVIDAIDLSSPTALWDKNNIANKFTLEQIDLENSNIRLLKSSKL